MADSITGRDPATGDLVTVSFDHGLITAVTGSGQDPAGQPWLVPGLVDLQVNGFAGHDVNAAIPDAEHIIAITAALAQRGVTTWVPTVITGTEAEICARLDAVTRARELDPACAAAIPFSHVEGPFLSDQDGPRGVHRADAIRPIDAAEVARWADHGRIGYVTVSPHWADSADQIRRVVDSGIGVALGHTHADPDQLRAAVDAGATLSTHLGNGIFAQLPRHPNPIWTQLAQDRLVCGLIGDGHHLPADTLTVMVRAKGPGGSFLVSDSVELAGSAPGRYRTTVGGEVELTADGKLSYPGTGLLAGAAACLADCLAWTAHHTGVPWPQVVAMATTIPGGLIEGWAPDWTGGRGRLEPGQPATICLLDDQARVQQVWVAGQRH